MVRKDDLQGLVVGGVVLGVPFAFVARAFTRSSPEVQANLVDAAGILLLAIIFLAYVNHKNNRIMWPTDSQQQMGEPGDYGANEGGDWGDAASDGEEH